MSAKHPGSAARGDRLASLVSSVVVEAGFDLEDLVQIPMGRRSLVRVVIDRDEGVRLDDVAEISQALSKTLDAADSADGAGDLATGKSPYVLEVTSPGVDRPLTEARHWRRAVGRLVEVSVSGESDQPPVRARVVACADESVLLAIDGAEQKFPLTDLGPGRIQLEFNRPPAGHDEGPS